MRKSWLLILLIPLLVACAPGDNGETTVRILTDDTPMFKGDALMVQDELEAYLPIDALCTELDAGSFSVQGVPVAMGLLECEQGTGWVHAQHYERE